MSLTKGLLDLLACPQCKRAVEYRREKEDIVCSACRLSFPVRDDIPVMLIDEATRLDDEN